MAYQIFAYEILSKVEDFIDAEWEAKPSKALVPRDLNPPPKTPNSSVSKSLLAGENVLV